MRGLFLAWVVGLGIMTVREVKTTGKPVPPGQYLGVSGVYAALSLVAEYTPLERTAVMAAWAFNLAVFFQAGPARIVGAVQPRAAQPGKTSSPTEGGR